MYSPVKAAAGHYRQALIAKPIGRGNRGAMPEAPDRRRPFAIGISDTTGFRKALVRSVAPIARIKINPAQEINQILNRSLAENDRVVAAFSRLISAWAASLTLVIV